MLEGIKKKINQGSKIMFDGQEIVQGLLLKYVCDMSQYDITIILTHLTDTMPRVTLPSPPLGKSSQTVEQVAPSPLLRKW